MLPVLTAIFTFIVAFISATLTAFICGIFVKLGYLDLWLVFAAIIAGDFISNTFWYILGRIGGRIFLATFGRLFGIGQEKLTDSMEIFNKYKDYATFFVSAPAGIAIMIISLMNAGIRRVTFFGYIAFNTLISIVWIWVILFAGSWFGYAFGAYHSITGRILTSLGAIVVLFLLLTLGAWVRGIILSTIYKPK
jgi:membrane protein DedA with SNARE-associated domain